MQIEGLLRCAIILFCVTLFFCHVRVTFTSVDRIEVCRYITLNWDDLRIRAIQRAVSRISRMTAAEACQRFLEAGEKYGEFDVNSINVIEELDCEHLDCVTYEAIEDLQQ